MGTLHLNMSNLKMSIMKAKSTSSTAKQDGKRSSSKKGTDSKPKKSAERPTLWDPFGSHK